MTDTTATPRRSAFLSSRGVRLGLGLAVSALCLYLAVRNVRVADAAAVLAKASLWYVALALASVGLPCTLTSAPRIAKRKSTGMEHVSINM